MRIYCDTRADDLSRANTLMIEALALLDRNRHFAAAHLDHAIVKLGQRPDEEGMPPAAMQAEL